VRCNTFPARNDLKQIHDYIAKDSRYYARNVIQKIVAKTETLTELPEIGRTVPEVGDQHVRELIVYSYRLIYEISESGVEILAIIHGRRDFKSAWDERDHQS
jgi:plasmid stabilization system protein ParE